MSQPLNNYYRNERKELSANIPQGKYRVLDVGCGVGNFGSWLKESGRATAVFGIEISETAAREAATKLDGIICTDLNTMDIQGLQHALGDQPFDYIVFGDVLEHLTNPWATLATLSALLSKGGRIVVSLPNVRHWSVLLPLLVRGRWDYQAEGIMDRTHLRFFTRYTACELIQGAGLHLRSISPVIYGRWRVLSKVSAGLLDGFLAVQYILLADRDK